MKFNKLILGLMVVAVFVGVWLLRYPSDTLGTTASNVVISEVQITGQNGADDEFVELYNPTASPIEMVHWRLIKRTASGGSPVNLVLNLNGTIPAYGYYLIAHPSYAGIVEPDQFYTATKSAMVANNNLTLYSDAGITVVDVVGWGTSTIAEGTPVDNPPTGGSIERKAASTATLADMLAGGVMALEGNGHDSNDNEIDFVVRERSQPQNSLVREMMGDAHYTALVDLTGEQETGEVTTSGSGKATVEINTTSKRLSYVVAMGNLTGVEYMAHIHGPATLGFDAPVLTPLPNGFDKQGEWHYADELEANILAGLTYINIHTYSYPDGELRGQIVFENGVAPTTTPTSLPTPPVTLTPNPTATLTPTITPSPTMHPTLTPTPTTIPTATPTPTTQPTSTPTPTIQPTVTPTLAPTPTTHPTSTLTPTIEPTSTPQPLPSLSPTPIMPLKGNRLWALTHACQISNRPLLVFGKKIPFPHLVCMLMRQ